MRNSFSLELILFWNIIHAIGPNDFIFGFGPWMYYNVQGWLNVYSFPFKEIAAATAAKSLQSCPTLCDPIDSSPPGSPVPGILQARTLEWVAISFSNAWKWKVEREVAQ